MLSGNERNLNINEKEVLAYVWCVEKFSTYLEHQDFDFMSDNRALTCLYTHSKQVGKIGRWIARLNRFRFKIAHVKGKDNTVAGCLSKRFDEQNYEVQKREGVVGTEGLVEYVEECGAIIKSIPEAFTVMVDWQAGDDEC
ncbi:hypothetical protein PR048_009144 [Dryococelus australis]|uniref:Reverse transcriptase RNase H-like domain-containing protein n=1 Tax=Dryococelus australis TaxID=614101 RepID=A0ABQ9HZZ9_9NEOP|nr:hypothetical protein PR048_009144 [Dryococelus australis]